MGALPVVVVRCSLSDVTSLSGESRWRSVQSVHCVSIWCESHGGHDSFKRRKSRLLSTTEIREMNNFRVG